MPYVTDSFDISKQVWMQLLATHTIPAVHAILVNLLSWEVVWKGVVFHSHCFPRV